MPDTTARMVGRTRPSWCPYCRAPAGIDCPDAGLSTRHAKHIEKRAVAREINETLTERNTHA